MNNIKIIFSDVDKTLVSNFDLPFSKKLIQCLKKLKERNILFILSSGRPTINLITIAQKINNDNNEILIKYVCGYNATEIYDVEKEEYIYKDEISIKNTKKINEILVEENIDYINYTLDAIFSNNPNNKYGLIEGMIFGKNPQKIQEIKSTPKVLGLVSDDITKKIEILKPKLYEFSLSASTPYFLEVTNKNVNKGTGMLKLIEILGINQTETMAFGDGGNDIEMIEYAHVGITLKNGIDAIKKCADIVLDDSVEEDAVANFLEEKLNV